MNYRLRNFFKNCCLFLFLLFAQQSQAQFVPLGPDTIYVDPISCTAPFFAHAEFTASNGETFAFIMDSAATGYELNDDVPAGTIVNASYIVTYSPSGIVETHSYPVSILDPNKPIFSSIPVSLITLSCFDMVPPADVLTATDDCDASVTVFYEEINTQTSDGSCTDSHYFISRQWTVEDSSGNKDTLMQQVSVLDNDKPGYVPLKDTIISCEQGIDPSVTGELLDVDITECNTFSINYSDVTIVDPDCPNAMEIERTWSVSDPCGNDSISIQMISVIDTLIPSFVNNSNDTIVSCEIGLAIADLGRPTMVQDNCDMSPLIYKTDFSLGTICANSYSFERRWYIEDDCGNIDSTVMLVNVVDTLAPVITTEALDEMITCVSSLEVENLFNIWISNHGGAIGTDNCSDNVTWNAFNTGTSTAANLPAATCPTIEAGISRRQTVDFVAIDDCGLADTTVATFTVIDITPPTMSSCLENTTINTESGICSADFNLISPVISEECGGSIGSENPIQTLLIFGQAGPPEETPVLPVSINLGVSGAPTVAADSATLTVILFNVDAEDPSEFFNILDENGNIVGQTVNSPAQCDNSSTILKFGPDDINDWAADGVISFTLEPNIPTLLDGRFAINPICPGINYVTTSLFYMTNTSGGLTYEYSINDEPRINPGSITSVTETFETGVNDVKYFITDCAGNQDSCSFQITVLDEETPSMTCPADLTLALEADSCTFNYSLPFPTGITDNCGVGNMVMDLQPNSFSDALINFSYEPNLTDFIASDKTFTFTNIGANAFGSGAELVVTLQADAGGTGAFYTLIDEDGGTLGTISGIDCTTPNTLTLSISASDFNSWASDGIITINAIANTNIPVPPGGVGDGINPCDPSMVQNSGDTDGTSYISIGLRYQEITPSYYTEGAAIIPLTQMMSPDFVPMEALPVGETEIFYIIEDVNNNADTCSYIITVEDTQNPIALCGPSFVTINPSGTVTDTIFAAEVNLGSTDNCGIDTMFVSPNIVTCNVDTLNVTLTVIDFAGNESTCETFVGVTSENPDPSYFVDCDNGMLQLSANAPLGVGGVSYIFEWSGPNAFLSFEENPLILEVDGARAGIYSVEITGVTGCIAEGVVEVLQSDLPPVTPDFFIVEDEICSSDDIVLTASSPSGSGSVDYIWYMEDPSGDIALDTTSSPFYTFQAPADSGTYCYYVTARSNDCFSEESIVKCVQVTSSPVAALDETSITVCEGEPFVLEAILPQAGPGVVFEFIGPSNSCTGTEYQCEITNPTVLDEGTYLLTAYENGCQSNTVTASVFVNPLPAQPEITSNSPICIGDTLRLFTNIPGGVYTWTSPNFTEFFTNINHLVLANSTEIYDGDWRVKVTSEEGCESENSENETVVVNPLPIISASGNNLVCNNEQIELSATDIVDADYTWYIGTELVGSGINVSLPPLAETYTVNVTDQNGCTSEDDITVALQDSPEIMGIAASDNDCPTGPEDVTLKALLTSTNDSPYSFVWTGSNFMSTDSCALIENATLDNNGSYQVVITGANSCADSASIQVTMGEIVNTPNIPNAMPGDELCEGDVITLTTAADLPGTDITWYWITPTGTIPTSNPSLIINPVSSANTGEYMVYAQVDNCFSDTSGVLLVTVNPLPVTTAECLNCPVCEGDDILLSADCGIPGAVYEWTSEPGIGSSLCSPIIPNADENLHEGTYFVRINVDGCWSETSSVFVSVSQRPNDPIASQNGPYCASSEDIELVVLNSSATPGATYHWYRIIGATSTEIGSTLSTSFDIPNSDTYFDGEYEFYVIAESGGCFSQQSPPITVSVSTAPNNQANAGEDIFMCEQEQIVLSAVPPSVGVGLWEQITGNPLNAEITNPDEAVTTVTGLEPGNTYGFRWTLSNGACINYSVDTAYVTVNLVELADAGNLIDTCAVTMVNLEGIAPSFGVGTWTQPNVQELLGVTIEDINNPNALVTGLVPGNSYIFTWNIEDNGCGGDADDVLIQISNENAFAGIDKDTCGFGCAPLNANPPQVGTGEWFSPNANISFTAPNSPTSQACGLATGDNILIWILNNGACGDAGIDSLVINYKAAPLAEDDLYTVSFAGVKDMALIENDDFPTEYNINIIEFPEHGNLEENLDGTFTYTADINFVGNDFFTYELCSSNCSCSEASVQLAIGGDATCDIPTIITPNNDNVNDMFVIPCLAEASKFPNNIVSIFNQWGDEVFRQAPYTNQWSGTYDGQELPAGTYFFIIDFGNNEKPTTGFLVLNR